MTLEFKTLSGIPMLQRLSGRWHALHMEGLIEEMLELVETYSNPGAVWGRIDGHQACIKLEDYIHKFRDSLVKQDPDPELLLRIGSMAIHTILYYGEERESFFAQLHDESRDVQGDVRVAEGVYGDEESEPRAADDTATD